MISLVSVRDRSSWQERGEGSASEAEMQLPRKEIPESGGAQPKGGLKSRENIFSGWAQSFYPHGKRLIGHGTSNEPGHRRDVPGAFENQAQVETTNFLSLSLSHS